MLFSISFIKKTETTNIWFIFLISRFSQIKIMRHIEQLVRSANLSIIQIQNLFTNKMACPVQEKMGKYFVINYFSSEALI